MKRFNIGYHAKVMLSGFVQMLNSLATAGLLGLAIYGFISIPSEAGYLAVADFICSVATLALALTYIYAQGRGWTKGNRKGGENKGK